MALNVTNIIWKERTASTVQYLSHNCTISDRCSVKANEFDFARHNFFTWRLFWVSQSEWFLSSYKECLYKGLVLVHCFTCSEIYTFFSKHLDWLFIAVFNATYICRTIVLYQNTNATFVRHIRFNNLSYYMQIWTTILLAAPDPEVSVLFSFFWRGGGLLLKFHKEI